MDEQITLTQNQIFSASLKVSKSRSLVKRRMQSLGLKFTESQDVRNRLAGIEKGALKCVGQFAMTTMLSLYQRWRSSFRAFSAARRTVHQQ